MRPTLKKSLRLTAGAAALTLCTAVSSAQAAPHGVKVGTLTCHVASGWGFVCSARLAIFAATSSPIATEASAIPVLCPSSELMLDTPKTE